MSDRRWFLGLAAFLLVEWGLIALIALYAKGIL